MRTTWRILAVAVLVWVGVTQSAASAQSGYAAPPTLTVDKVVAVAGETVIISGANFLPDATIELSYNPPIGQTTTDADGRFSYAWSTVGLAVGDYTVTATDGVNSVAVQVRLVASAAETGETAAATGAAAGAVPTTAAGSLPITGVSTDLAARAAALLLVGGALLVLAARHRSAGH